jgi:hypothetical protein
MIAGSNLADPKSPPLDLLVPFPDELTKAWRIKLATVA